MAVTFVLEIPKILGLKLYEVCANNCKYLNQNTKRWPLS